MGLSSTLCVYRLCPDDWEYCCFVCWGYHLLCVSIDYILMTGIIVALCDGVIIYFVCMSICVPSRLHPDNWSYCCFHGGDHLLCVLFLLDLILMTGVIAALCEWGYHLLCVSIGVPSRLLPDNWSYCCFMWMGLSSTLCVYRCSIQTASW